MSLPTTESTTIWTMLSTIIMGKVKLSEEMLVNGLKDGRIVSCNRGGLVLGNYHLDGGVKIIAQISDTEYDVSEMEGWEFIINPIATDVHRARLTEINLELKSVEEPFDDYIIPNDISIIDARSVVASDPNTSRALLAIGEMYIINKWSTRTHLSELNTLNKTLNK